MDGNETPLQTLSTYEAILRCPRCHSELHKTSSFFACANTECRYSEGGQAFPVVADQPVLIDFEKSIVERESFSDQGLQRAPGAGADARLLPQRVRGAVQRILRGKNRIAEKLCGHFISLLKKHAAATDGTPVVLVLGGGTEGSGAANLYRDASISVIGTDVYPSDMTSLVCDAHQLPFETESMDGVWIQAVLEHVLDPNRVVAEIHRVLKPDGFVYADTPFMQQVHMGAYDFTRFTLSGHRWLFRKFALVESGVSGSPGLATIWSIRYLARALGASDNLAGLIAAPFFWLRFLTGARQSRRMADAASGVYFLGTKSDRELEPREIIDYYRDFGRESTHK